MESVHGRYALRRWGSAAAALLPLLVCLILPALAFGRARADLQVSALAGGHAESGLHLRATVRNSGGAASRRSTVGFWLSSDGRRDRGDVRLGGSALKALRPGRSVHVSKSVPLPAAMPAGARPVLACADELSRVRESRESNNCRITRISLPGETRVPPVSNPPAPLPFALLPPAPAVPGPAPAAAAVSLGAPLDGAYVATATPALTGTGSTSSFVTVYIRRAGALVATLTTLPADGGSWSLSPPVLPDGAYTVEAQATGPLGDTVTSGARAFTVDTAEPALAIALDPSSPNGSGGAYATVPAVGVTADDVNLSALACTVDGSPAALAPDAASAQLSVAGAGSHTVACTATDRAAHTSSATRSFTVSSVAPAVTLLQPAGGSFTADTTPGFSGAADTAPGDVASVSVKVYAGTAASGSPVRTLAATVSGSTWSAAASPALSEGTYTAQAEQSNSFGDVGRSAPRTFTVDTSAPSPTLAHPTASSAANDSTPTLDGGAGTAAGDSATVTVRIYNGSGTGGTLARTLTATASGGSWSATPATALPDGTYTAQAQQQDAAGNSGSSPAVTFTIDTAAPAPTLAHPVDGSATNDTTPAFDGTAGTATGDSTTVRVKIYAGSSASGSPVQTVTTTASAGAWSTSGSTLLSEGTYTAQADQSDSAGNTGTSAARTFRVDTTAPAVALADPVDGSATNDTTPALDGSAGTASGDSSTVAIKIYSGSSATGTPAQTLTATAAGGSWSATAASLVEGTWTAQAEQSDGAGNSAKSAPHTFVVDTTAPAVTLAHPTASSSTNDSTPDFDGSAGTAARDQTGVTVKVYAGSSATGTPVRTQSATASAGSWSATLASALGDGTYTAQAEQPDGAGNTGRSAARTFTVDTTAPGVTLVHPADGSSTSDPTPTFDGAAGTSSGDSATVAVKVYSGSSATGTPVRTLTTTASAGAWSATPGTTLADGTYTARAEQSDAAGNTGTSTSRTFTIDASGPAVTLTSPVDGSAVATSTPAFGGGAGTATGDLSAVTVKLYTGSTATGTPARTLTATASGATWSATPGTGLADGTWTAQAEQADGAGNTGTSAARTFRVDTSAPSVTLAHPTAGSTSSDQYPTFDGTAGTSTGDASSVTVRVYSGSSTTGTAVQTLSATRNGSTGAWSVQASAALPVGTYTARAEQADDAGHLGQSSSSTFSSPAVLMAAGDIASCDQTGDSDTGSLLAANSSDAVSTLGDNVYDEGAPTEFSNCFAPTWGLFKSKIHPSVGNHEYYYNSTASGYFGYYGSAAGTAGQGWYSYDLGGWHVVVLNSNDNCAVVSCDVGSAQEQWLKADLAAHDNQCTLAYWHAPRFSSGANGGTLAVQAFWNDLYDAGADVVLNGHDHDYERFAPQDPGANSDPSRGIREFVVGTGGYTEYEFGTHFEPNSQVHSDQTHGVLQLVLRPGGYSWTFLPVAGSTFTDSGSGSCH